MISPIHLIGKLDSAGSPRTQGSNVARLLRGSWRKDDLGIVADPVYLTEAELTEITPTLCRSGAGALAWGKIRNTPLAATAAGRELHDVYRRFRLSALRHEREIANVFSLLRAAGIEAVLVKGWAIARRYPDRALRPYGDIDLCVAPAQFAEASEVLKRVESIDGPFVDLHCGFDEVGRSKAGSPGGQPAWGARRQEAGGKSWTAIFPRLGRRTVRKGYAFLVPVSSAEATPQESGGAASGSFMESDGKAEPYRTVRRQSRGVELDSEVASKRWNEVFARTLVVDCGGEPVRILSDEDHLRILCLHLLRSGARRPTWLCDVALLVEQVQSPKSKVQSPDTTNTLWTLDVGPWTDFDWNICFGRNPVHANWVSCAIRLAHELLGANMPEEVQRPTSNVQSPLPRWLVPAVLQQWGRTTVGSRQQAVGSRKNLRLLVKTGSSSDRVSREQSPTSNVPSHLGVQRHWTSDIGLWTDLYRRWDNPIRATAAVGGQFNNWPRLPYHILESIMRLPELPRHLRLLVAPRTEVREQRSEVSVKPFNLRTSDL